MAGRWLVGIILLFMILLMMLPDRDEQSLSRIGSASMLACTKALRSEVAEQLRDDRPVSVRFDNTCPELIASLEVNREGGMVIRGKRYKVTLRLEPVMEGGTLRWSCRGEPQALVTTFCRP